MSNILDLGITMEFYHPHNDKDTLVIVAVSPSDLKNVRNVTTSQHGVKRPGRAKVTFKLFANVAIQCHIVNHQVAKLSIIQNKSSFIYDHLVFWFPH
ncbi:hypothetical protein M8J77_011978 [Diaphorina citri]|nr:hypothetical protein M8J77_011978 [Diaphorina citri]